MLHMQGQVCKRVWEMTFFGLKLGLDLEMRAAHPHQKFQGVPPPVFLHLAVVRPRYTGCPVCSRTCLLSSFLSNAH